MVFCPFAVDSGKLDRHTGHVLVQVSKLRLLGPPVLPFYLFFGEGSTTKIDYRQKGYPYSNLSTGGPGAGYSCWCEK